MLEKAAEFFKRILDDNKIRYAIIGGVAVGVYGKPRFTSDIDITLLIKKDEVDNLLDLIERAGLAISRKEKVREKLKAYRAAKIVWNEKQSVDIRLASYTIDHESIKYANTFTVFGQEFKFVGPEELIAYKLARFDGTDQSDIRSLIKSLQKKIDWEKVEELAKQLSHEAALPKMADNFATVLSWRRKT